MLYEKAETPFELFYVKIREANDVELAKISSERGLALDLNEMRLVQKHFRALGRDASDVELESIAQTWSEHCGHKTFKGEFDYREGAGSGAKKKEVVKNLFKNFVARATRELACDWCYSVFEDNAGIVDFEGDYAVAFKVETHNHPSALEPFGGAATGVGGVIRDVLGVWGEPIANTDVLCFGPLDMSEKKLPAGAKHPRYLYGGVIAGIGAYGNNMGIPTVNGSIFFDESYAGNPLVYCGTVGLVKKSLFVRQAKPGDVALIVGGKTGRDGIHGVTFASEELRKEKEEESRCAVQIGDPIEEEKVKRGVLEVRERKLASAITDLGGGGLSSAVSELANRFSCGIDVELSELPLKYPVNTPWEIWVSESQERMLLAVPKKNLEAVKKIFADEEVDATAIGQFNSTKRLRIRFKGVVVADLDLNFLFSQPLSCKQAVWAPPRLKEPRFAEPRDLTGALKKILASPNVCSKESVVRTYDHEVKGATVLKPLQGAFGDAPGDAAVLKPLRDSMQGIVVSNGLNPEYGKIDAYWMAAGAIDEAIRNNVCVGGRRIALLDNFCWGNPNKPDRAGSLVRAARACYDFARALGTPFISGKDSLFNESARGPITPTLLVSALGVIPDVRNAVSMDAKRSGDVVYLVGETLPELGGSHYYKVLKKGVGASVPRVNALKAKKTFEALTRAIDARLVEACHDLSEGGLGVAASEMCFGGGVGTQIDLRKAGAKTNRSDLALFSESNTRFLAEVKPENAREFEKFFAAAGILCREIGFLGGSDFRVTGLKGKPIIEESIAELKNAWQNTLLK